MTNQELIALVNENFPNNVIKAITPVILRNTMHAIILSNGNAVITPPFGSFRWIMRGTDHNSLTPIAGDVFEGIISQTGEPLQFSSSLIWNGIGPLNNTNLANFEIRQST
jgi:hypothetical protein